MHSNLAILIAAVAVVTVIAFVLYRLKNAERIRAVKERVRDHLRKHYGEVPDELIVNCSDDERWPILVSFVEPRSHVVKRLQFKCSRSIATFRVHAEV